MSEKKLTVLLLSMLIGPGLLAQDRTVDATWLRRSVPLLSKTEKALAAGECQYAPIFGEGDQDSRILRTVTRVGQVTISANGSCPAEDNAGEEEIYFVLEGNAVMRYADQTHGLAAKDFTYVAPGVRHSMANNSAQAVRVLLMRFKIPQRITRAEPPTTPKIVNLDNLKEETVEGHPTSVLYKLMVGPRTATRDAIDQAYMVTSLFWMDFAPGGTNFPHHHEGAEEIYVVMDGEGQMVAGSGMDGIEARYPAKAGDAYYFRPNCTVGFYNQDKPGAKAHILAVRARIPPLNAED
jgi:mannose-6-phosphate isomerase-like protein (cupin superfamily)